MPYITSHYQLSALKSGDTWFPDVDQRNMQIIENLLQSAEYFVQNGILQLNTCTVLSSATGSIKQNLYNAAFDYYNDIFFNAENYDLHFIANEDIVVDLVSKTNINLSNIFQQKINGANIIPGYKIFLTSQSISSQNGVYQISLSGASLLPTQPRKVFVNNNDPIYQYSIFLFNSATYSCINSYDCLIAVDGLITIQNSRAVTSQSTAYLRPTLGSGILTIYSPENFYGSGTPILYFTNLANDPAVTLATFSTSGSSFANYNYVFNLSLTNSGSYLTNFNSQTYNQQPSYKPLHLHSNNNLELSNFIKLILLPVSEFSNSCNVYDIYGNTYNYSSTTQKIEAVYVNEQKISTSLLNYNSSTRTFNFLFPVGYNDVVYCIASKSAIQTLSPLTSLNNNNEYYTLQNSGNVTPYTWEDTTYDNYNLYINGSNISQQSFNVNYNTGLVTINQPNISNLPSDPNVFSGSTLELSLTTNDPSSFFGKTDKINSINPNKISGNINNYRAKHNQFDTQTSTIGYNLCPFRAIGNNVYQVPYYNGDSFNNVQPISPIKDACSSNNFTIVNIDGFLFVVLNQQLKSILSEYSDKNYSATIIKTIQNTENSFIILFTNYSTSNQYAISIVNLDTDTYTTNQFIFGSQINDVSAYFDGTNINIFIASNTGTYTANFNNLTPVFNKLYYNYSYSGSNLYSYNNHQVQNIIISEMSNNSGPISYEGYILINNYPNSGSQVVSTINSQVIIYTGSNLNIFATGITNGVSDRGIIVGDNNNMYITSSPVVYSGSVLFPYTYGTNIQISNNNISCYTSTISSISSFSGASISALDAQNISAGQYILVRQQPYSNQNGIYLINSSTGSYFTATQQILSNASVGNYVLVHSGSKHSNSYWEISPLSTPLTNNLMFRLRSTNLGSGLGSSTKLFTDLNNSVYLSSSGSILNIYDSSNIAYDIYKHQFTNINTNNQILSASSTDNLIISNKAILSENFSGSNQGCYSFVDYTYPLSQGGTIYIKNANVSWLLNQLINLNFNGNNIQACVNNISGSTYTAVVTNAPTISLGQSQISSYNLTFGTLIQNNYFQQNWYNGIFGINSGSYLTALNSSQYSGSLLTDSITIIDSNYFGAAIYGKINVNQNLQIDSVNNYDQNSNTSIESYNNCTVSEFNQVLDSEYNTDHNTAYKTLFPDTPILIDNNNSALNDNISTYTGVISTLTGSQFITISDNSINPSTNPTDTIVYESRTKKSHSIENKIFGNNQFSAQTFSNDVILNNNFLSAITNYNNAIPNAIYEDIVIDSAMPSTYEPLLSDFNTGISNFAYDSWLGISDESVHTIFSLNGYTYAVIQGKIIKTGTPSTVISKINFNFCYFAITNSNYVLIGTDKGLYVYDTNFNLLFKTLLDHKVKSAKFISSYQVLIGVENNLCYINFNNYSSDYLLLPVNSINAINVINNNVENVYLIGTDQGLYGVTLNAGSSSQTLITGNGLIGSKALTITNDFTITLPTANQNNVLGIYNSLSNNLPSENLVDSIGQPNIYDIAVVNSSVYLATENGISLYESLYSVDMQNSSNNIQNFELTSKPFTGFEVNKMINFYDSTSKINAYFVSTFDGVYYSFDNLNTFIKSSLNMPAFSVLATGSSWNIATSEGLYQTFNYGATFTGTVVARGSLLNNNQNLDMVIQMNNDYQLNSINLPVYATSGSYLLNLNLSSTNYLTGEPLSVLATASFSTGSLMNGYYTLPFVLNTPLSLKKYLTYNITINAVSSNNIYVADQNFSTLAFSVLSCKSTGSISNIAPAIKLCQNSINANVYINQPVLPYQLINTSNILIDNNDNIYSYPSAEINFIIDDSNSFINSFGGISNINNFITTLQTQFTSKIGSYCFFNTIFTDDYLTNFSNTSTGSAPLASTGSQLSRITDALCLVLERNNATPYATSTISSGSFVSYINGALSHNAAPYVFKNILNSARYYPNLQIQYNYNTPLINNTSYNITQNGFTGAISGSTYVFVDNAYANLADYSLNTYFTYTGTSITNKKVSDVQIFTSTGSFNVPTISALNSGSKYFGNNLASWLASSQSKIIVILTDNIDNDSVESISNFISLVDNTNTLVVLCSLSIESGNIYTALSENIISIGRLNSETISAYITRVNLFINNLTHKTFGGVFDLILDNSVTSISLNFTSLNVFGIMRDLDSGNIIENVTFASGVPINTTNTNQQKRITIFFQGTGTITGIYETYSYAPSFLYSRTLISGSSYNNELVFGNLTKGLGNSKANFYPVSGSNSIHQLSSGWSTSPHGTPFWTKEGSDVLNVNPFTISGSATLIPSNISGYNKYYVEGPSSFTRLPINSQTLLSTGTSWYDWYNNFVYSLTTGSNLTINSTINSLLAYRYPYNEYNSAQNSIVPYDNLISYLRNNRSLIFDGTRQFKLFQNIETYNNYSYSNKINLYLSGNIPNNSVENKFIRYSYNQVNVTYHPTLPLLQSIVPNFTKYQDSNVTIFGYNVQLPNNPGRKPITINNSLWTVSGSQINTYALYTGSNNILNNLSINLNNTAGESTGSILSTFVTDTNFTPIIISITTLINGNSANTAGLNDIATLSVLIDRKDGTSNSQYIYQNNTGDQIVLLNNWYGVISGSVPTLIYSGNNLQMSSAFIGLYDYVFAKVQVTRALTIGTIMDSAPIFLNN